MQRREFVSTLAGAALAAPPARPLKVGIAQIDLPRKEDLPLARNRQKILSFVDQAAAEKCRVVIFPESALCGTATDEPAEMRASLDAIATAAALRQIYVVMGGASHEPGQTRAHQWMVVFDPAGKEAFQCNKLYDKPTSRNPDVFHIDGIPCNTIICADRWLRAVEDLPIMKGVALSIELSSNFDAEWVQDLGWYWYGPRAIRNGCYVVFANTAGAARHGHSAVIAPDGSMVASSGNEERLVTAVIDPAKATGAEARRRREHPVFKPFWQTGLNILSGSSCQVEPLAAATSPELDVKLAAAQMASSSRIDDNLAKMEKLIREAARQNSDAIVFPELAVTGAREADILKADAKALTHALDRIRKVAGEAKIHAIFGMPWHDGDKRRNSAFAVGPDGALLTRYDQLAVDRPRLFEQGGNAGSMWFKVKGVPAVLTIGRDGLWSEIAEMASLAGAQLHFYLSHDTQDSQRRLQIQACLASWATFTATVNAAPGGGTAIWEDMRRPFETGLVKDERPPQGAEGMAIYSPFSANCLVRAGSDERILYATQRVNRINRHHAMTKNPAMAPWYAMGARVVRGAAAGSGNCRVSGPSA